MVKIQLLDKQKYFLLRDEYLEIISKYIAFDKADIILGSKSDEPKKTEKTADKLKTSFPELYRFLFYEDSYTVNRDNLRYLLVGPDSLPQSFGGDGEKKTMQECLEDIAEKCPLPYGKEAKECCKEIFQYEKFRRNQQATHHLLRMMNVRVCPYCNRIYIVTLPSKEELENNDDFRATRATFDHFYCQDKFPHLALSLFNLIPSCHFCNLNKGNSEKKIVYPYDEEFGKDAVFRVTPDFSREARLQCSNVLSFLHGDSEWFHIKFMGHQTLMLNNKTELEKRLSDIGDEKFRERIRYSIEVFHLEELYKEHKMEVKDILRNNFIFNKEYVRNVLVPLLLKKGGVDSEKGKNPKVMEEMVTDMLYFARISQKEWGKRPLSKLVSDILEQVEVFDCAMQ